MNGISGSNSPSRHLYSWETDWTRKIPSPTLLNVAYAGAVTQPVVQAEHIIRLLFLSKMRRSSPFHHLHRSPNSNISQAWQSMAYSVKDYGITINHRCSTEGTKIRYQNLTTGSSTNPTGSVAVRTLDTRTSTKRITDEVGPIVATYLANNSIVQLNWQVPLVGSSSDRINGLTDASRGRFMLYIRALQLRYW